MALDPERFERLMDFLPESALDGFTGVKEEPPLPQGYPFTWAKITSDIRSELVDSINGNEPGSLFRPKDGLLFSTSDEEYLIWLDFIKQGVGIIAKDPTIRKIQVSTFDTTHPLHRVVLPFKASVANNCNFKTYPNLERAIIFSKYRDLGNKPYQEAVNAFVNGINGLRQPRGLSVLPSYPYLQ